MRLIRHIRLQKTLEGVVIKDGQSTLAITMHNLQRTILLIVYPYAGFRSSTNSSPVCVNVEQIWKRRSELRDTCRTFVNFLLLLRGAGCCRSSLLQLLGGI